jgi:hypothetical protein
MTSNPFDDNYDPDAQPTFEGPEEDEGPDEDIIPEEDKPAPHVNWTCTGVAAGNLKRVGTEAHMMPAGSMPDQGTTDASGAFMQGACVACNDRTIWKKVTL